MCESGVKFQTVISRKRSEITISIWYANYSGAQALSIGKWLRSSRRSYKRESWSKFDFGLRAIKIVGNDSSPYLKMFGEVSKPLSAELSEIFKSGPQFRIGLSIPKLSLLSKKYQFCHIR